MYFRHQGLLLGEVQLAGGVGSDEAGGMMSSS